MTNILMYIIKWILIYIYIYIFLFLIICLLTQFRCEALEYYVYYVEIQQDDEPSEN